MIQRKILWEQIIHKGDVKGITQDEYRLLKQEVFNGAQHLSLLTINLSRHLHIDHIPDFGSGMRWNHRDIHLTTNRMNAAKMILCVLAHYHATLSHSPCLPDLLCLFLIFYPELTVFNMIQQLIRRSQHEHSYYITLSGREYLKWLKTFARLVEQHIPALYTLMQERLKIDVSKLFHLWLSRFFVNLFPFRTIFRIVDCYLQEGNKVLFRVGLGILKLHEKELKKCTTAKEFLTTLHTFMSQQLPDPLLKISFGLYLSRTHLEKIAADLSTTSSTHPLPTAHNPLFHLPRFQEEQSEMMSILECYAIWKWLPPGQKIQDPKLLYCASKQGYSLDTLWQSSLSLHSNGVTQESQPLFLLFRSQDSVIGMFLPQGLPVKKTSLPQAISYLSFLFQVKPSDHVYKTEMARWEEEQKRKEMQRQHPTNVNISRSGSRSGRKEMHIDTTRDVGKDPVVSPQTIVLSPTTATLFPPHPTLPSATHTLNPSSLLPPHLHPPPALSAFGGVQQSSTSMYVDRREEGGDKEALAHLFDRLQVKNTGGAAVQMQQRHADATTQPPSSVAMTTPSVISPPSSSPSSTLSPSSTDAHPGLSRSITLDVLSTVLDDSTHQRTASGHTLLVPSAQKHESGEQQQQQHSSSSSIHNGMVLDGTKGQALLLFSDEGFGLVET